MLFKVEDSGQQQPTSQAAASPSPDARRLPSPERLMGVSPLDMRQARFGSAMRGYDKGEVTSFLDEAAAGYEGALRENERLRQEIARLEASLTQYREIEGSLKSTMMTAQRVADDMRSTAARESERIVREAEGRAELLVQKAHARLEDIQREIDGMRHKRREVQTSLESCVSALQNTLEFIREQDTREREARIVAHRPRVEAAAS